MQRGRAKGQIGCGANRRVLGDEHGDLGGVIQIWHWHIGTSARRDVARDGSHATCGEHCYLKLLQELRRNSVASGVVSSNRTSSTKLGRRAAHRSALLFR